MTKEFLDFLTAYDWPGNVRELQNLVERLVILSDSGWLQISDLPDRMFAGPQGVSLVAQNHGEELTPVVLRSNGGKARELKDIERGEIEASLKRHGWVQSRAARELGLTQRQIGYKIKKYGLKRPDQWQ